MVCQEQLDKIGNLGEHFLKIVKPTLRCQFYERKREREIDRERERVCVQLCVCVCVYVCVCNALSPPTIYGHAPVLAQWSGKCCRHRRKRCVCVFVCVNL